MYITNFCAENHKSITIHTYNKTNFIYLFQHLNTLKIYCTADEEEEEEDEVGTRTNTEAYRTLHAWLEQNAMSTTELMLRYYKEIASDIVSSLE